MKLKTFFSLVVTATFFSTASDAIELGKPIPANVILKSSGIKHVYLLNIKLTPSQRRQFTTYKPLNPNLVLHSNDLPPEAHVSMNNTPVFDQGIHGTCVTFANISALDAILGKGDYVSQLCSLELGKYLEDHSYYDSGWDGASGETVLNELIQFGIVNTNTQKTKKCGGLKKYPAYSFDRGTSMTPDDYHTLGENIKNNIFYRPMMTFVDRTNWGTDIDQNSAIILQHVKDALVNKPDPTDPNSSGRVTFAVMLPIAYCSAGACGNYHAPFDTWALTDAIKKDPYSNIGEHEMVITGFDDNAIVKDNEGKIHQGLLTLRNSWGTDAGDNGDYYMTYEFFRQYVVEVQEVTLLNINP